MIPLLSELEAAESTALLPDDLEHQRTLRLLGWDRVAALVARFCRTRHASEAIRTRRPFIDLAPITLHRDLQDELSPLDTGDDPVPLFDLSDTLDLFERPRPWRLDGSDLLHIAATAHGLDVLRDWVLKNESRCPRWAAAFGLQPPLDAVHNQVHRVLDRDGRLKDDASPLLARLRRTIRQQERHVRSEAMQVMSDARAKGWTNGPEVTLRGDRFCLPLLSGSRRKINGIVHDRSATGGTVYVEPAAVVHMQNDLVESRLEASAEADRILLELNSLVEARSDDVMIGARLLLRVDETLAAIRWSRKVGAVRPALESGGVIDLRSARHPLLLAQAESLGEVVPLDLQWPEEARAVVISGPNAGGKSVALKGVGVQIMLAQCGWDVVAGPGTTLPLVRQLYVDLGDDQSITRSLSSFSAHLEHLGHFLSAADQDTLVLCDEIGSGTDPDEGTALAFTVLESLLDSGALVLASTHYGLLKAAVDDHPAMVNAAMDFDDETLRPLYSLRIGVPGASHAFDIAARMGLPDSLLHQARERVGEDRFQVERLLTELSTRARRLADTEVELSAARARAETKDKELKERLAGLKKERAALLEKSRREGEDLLQEGRRTLERIVKDIRSGSADSTSIKAGRDALQNFGKGLPEKPAKPVKRDFTEGDRIRIPHLGLVGVVMEARSGRYVVDANGMRLTLDRDAVEPLDKASSPQESSPSDSLSKSPPAWYWQNSSGPVEQEIDLRGYRIEEGWDTLDRLLDRAIPAGTHEIRVIHGHGTGQLRAYLRQRLKNDPRVGSYGDAPPDQGGDGCTVLRLAE